MAYTKESLLKEVRYFYNDFCIQTIRLPEFVRDACAKAYVTGEESSFLREAYKDFIETGYFKFLDIDEKVEVLRGSYSCYTGIVLDIKDGKVEAEVVEPYAEGAKEVRGYVEFFDLNTLKRV